MMTLSMETKRIPVEDTDARHQDRMLSECLRLQVEIDVLRVALANEKQAVEEHRRVAMALRGKLTRAEIALGQLRQELVGWEGRTDLEPLFRGAA